MTDRGFASAVAAALVIGWAVGVASASMIPLPLNELMLYVFFGILAVQALALGVFVGLIGYAAYTGDGRE
jgi:hypothetical protein